MEEEKAVKQQKNNFDWLREIGWQKGQSGNPKGRPKGKTLKDFTRDFLSNMSEEARLEFLKELPAETIWRMAEGNPHSTSDSKVEVTTPEPILGGILKKNENERTNTEI
jgi:hypothetical protein